MYAAGPDAEGDGEDVAVPAGMKLERVMGSGD